jgi:hypothetical protein
LPEAGIVADALPGVEEVPVEPPQAIRSMIKAINTPAKPTCLIQDISLVTLPHSVFFVRSLLQQFYLLLSSLHVVKKGTASTLLL